MQANIFSKLKKIIISFIVVIITMQSICFAGFTDAQKEEIWNFANKVKGMNTAYTLNGDGLKEGFYLRETECTAYDGHSGTYIWLCCATWVSTIFYQKFGIDMGPYKNGTEAYAMTDGTINSMFEEVPINSEYQAGDVFLWYVRSDGFYGHVGMYLGVHDGQGWVTDCGPSDRSEWGNGHNYHGGVFVRPTAYHDTPALVIRYKGNATSTENEPPDDLTPALNKIESTWKYRKVPFRKVANVDENKTFEYQGIGKVESKTTQEKEDKGLFETLGDAAAWVWSKISALLEWILNFILTIIKGIFVGIGTFVQMFVSYYMDAASGEDVSSRFPDGMMAYLSDGGLKKDIANSVTLEKIVYNQVPLLDTDVFNGNIAGGKTLSSSSLVIIIRNTVAGFYRAMRTASLIGMLLALIYYGVKFVASGVAEAKAEYKQKLASWAIGFFIVFGLHYFLIIVMKVNELTVGLLRQIGTNIASAVSRRGIF